MSNYNKLFHCKYLVQYHLIWWSKFRFEVLIGDISDRLKEILLDVSKKYDFEIVEMEIMSDHIHLFVSAKPTSAPTDIVRALKSISSITLFKEFPQLKRFYAKCGSLWSKGYFVSTVGKISEETVKQYIKEQKQKER